MDSTGLAAGLAAGVADAELAGVPEAVGVADVLAPGDGLAVAPSWLAPTAWPEPVDDVELPEGDGLADLPLAVGLLDEDGVGVGVAAAVV